MGVEGAPAACACVGGRADDSSGLAISVVRPPARHRPTRYAIKGAVSCTYFVQETIAFMAHLVG